MSTRKIYVIDEVNANEDSSIRIVVTTGADLFQEVAAKSRLLQLVGLMSEDMFHVLLNSSVTMAKHGCRVKSGSGRRKTGRSRNNIQTTTLNEVRGRKGLGLGGSD